MPKSTRKIGELPVSEEITELLESELSWDSARNSFYGLTDSRSMLLKYNIDFPEGMFPKVSNVHLKILKLMTPAIELVQMHFKDSYCTRAIIACLPSKKEVKAHIDPGWPFSIQRRYCWVLKTNKLAIMNVGGKDFHFSEGEIWEFDNKSMHKAYNGGETDRIHMIFDLAVMEDSLAVTPTPFGVDTFDEKFFRIVLKKKNKTGLWEI